MATRRQAGLTPDKSTDFALTIGEQIVGRIVNDGQNRRFAATTERGSSTVPFEEQVQRVILGGPEGRGALATTISNAIATLTARAAVPMTMMPTDLPKPDPGGGEGGGGGGGGGGGSAPAVQVNFFWWGVQVVFTEPTIKYLLGIAGIEGALLGALGALPALSVVPWLVPALAAYIAIQALLIGLVDQGNGVYLSMLWVAPGVFVPTSI